MEITALEIVFAISILLCLGSAISVYLRRTPAHEEFLWRKEAHQLLELEFNELPPASFFRGRSHCPKCQHILTIRDLIPIVSFIINKQKCRYCKEQISWFYFTIEIATLCICLPLVWVAQNPLELMLLSLIFCSLLTISLMDWQYQWIPDQLNVFLLGLSLWHALLGTKEQLYYCVLGMIVGYLFIMLLRELYLYIKGVEAIGIGDAKLLAALGAWQGIDALFMIIFYASLLGITYALLSKKTAHQTIAFGPFLCLAAVITFAIPFT